MCHAVSVTATGPVLDGRYRLIAPIATGGMSVVWRGHDDVLARPVAIKVLTAVGGGHQSGAGAQADGRAGSATFAERVRREAMAIARISHPHVANVYDYGESTDGAGTTVPYIVMELVEGESLAQVLARGPLSWPTAAGICAQVAAGLAAAHQLGVVHRDVTPANVMLCVDGVKVVDFGISATTGQSADAQLFGTPAYLAPERLSGCPALPATDVYGVGLLLYQAIAGQLPWSATTTTQMLAAHQYVPPAPLPAIAGMPARVAVLCQRTLAVDPVRRPTSAEVCGELSTLARHGDPRARAALPGSLTPTRTQIMMLPVEPGIMMPRGRTRVMPIDDPVSTTVPIDARATPRPGRRRGVFVLPAVLMLFLVGCLGFAQMHQQDGKAPTSPSPTPTKTAPGLVDAPPPAVQDADPPVTRGCTVTYELTSRWIIGFTAQVTILNTGTAAIGGWALTFQLPPGQRVAGGWNGRFTQSGDQVTVRGVAYDDLVPAGGSVTIGFLGTQRRNTGDTPLHFSLNGMSCAGT
jgi:serine/threonine-protein kinase